ncbi:hypothetical protein CA13_66440 [Planctomycetes bacterium CA13]|uniref:FG-GAP repeat protein n=1 Tax=Novipirellula herctigrandis TaxID=2527986 RepID=A0A5C5ZCV9_9BACT|nr:hypothetical protein CA13_66440 [Planctomycetes bacterium CA13]
MLISRLVIFACIIASVSAQAEENVVHSFDRVQLTSTYFSEGANAGDINGDGVADAVYGLYWFAGPDYKT